MGALSQLVLDRVLLPLMEVILEFLLATMQTENPLSLLTLHVALGAAGLGLMVLMEILIFSPIWHSPWKHRS